MIQRIEALGWFIMQAIVATILVVTVIPLTFGISVYDGFKAKAAR